MTVDAGKPHCGFISEGKRHSLLQIAPPDHRSITMSLPGETAMRRPPSFLIR